MASRRSLKKTVNYITELAAGLCLVESANNGKLTAKYSCRLSTCVMTSSAASATQSRAA